MSSSPPNPHSQTLTLNSLHLHRSLPPPPLSKLIPNTNFIIDGFRYSSPSAAYFLSHFHSDHYTGLSSAWAHGLIFCSPVTSSLLTRVLNVPKQFIVPLPIRESVIIDGCEVVLVDANHCPGAVQFLFRVPSRNGGGLSECYVHTGDFRFCRSMKDDNVLSRFVGCDAVFLDTTYCNPKFVFPSQEESIDHVVNVVERIGGLEFVSGSENKNVLFLVATYVIGKEKILLEIARRCNRKICVDGRKMEIIKVLGYGESGVFTEDQSESDVHVVGWNVLGETWPYFRPNFVKMKEIMEERGYSRVVGFVPTGWTYEVKRNKFAVRSKDSFEIHLVPYSEHSNYDELREYVKFLRPKRVIPTVGVDVEKLDSKHVSKMRKHFAGLVDEMANKKEFLMGFFRGSSEHAESTDKVEMNGESNVKVAMNSESEVKVGLEAASLKDGVDQDRDLEGNDPGVILNSPPTFEEDRSHISLLPNNEETDRILQELRDCLPTWVTQDQMLDMINRSGMNIVEAISYFYENETEFHEQVFSCKRYASTSQAGSVDNPETEVLSMPVSAELNRQSLSVTFSEKFKSPIKKSSPSSGKRKRNTDNKISNKIKSKSKQESGGPKQSTITSFFGKSLPHASQETVNESLCDDPLPNDDVEPYTEEIDQFLSITGGDESSRKYAAVILEKTGGDINKALDLHYRNSEGAHGAVVETPVVSENLDFPQPHTNRFSSSYQKNVVEVAEHCVDPFVTPSLQENSYTVLVSLPPEKYDPIKHACWKAGEPAPYIHLARTFDLVEAEKGKIKATAMLCNMFRRFSAQLALFSAYQVIAIME